MSEMEPYPRWRFFPAFHAPPAWVHQIAEIFRDHRAHIDHAQAIPMARP
jgi:hypothetical protein